MAESKLSTGMSGDKVKALHAQLRELGFQIPRSEADAGLFGPATVKAVRKYQKDHGLEVTGVVGEATAAALDAAQPKRRKRGGRAATTPATSAGNVARKHPRVQQIPPEIARAGAAQAGQCVVRGKVTNSAGLPVAGVMVNAFDKDLRSEDCLGSASTSQDGRYEITYSAKQSAPGKKTGVDLIVRASVMLITKRPKLLAQSPILFNAGPEEIVNLTVVDKAYQGPSDYENLSQKLQPLVQTVPLPQLREDAVNRDISFLASKTGASPQDIGMLAAAARLAEQTALKPEVFYALFRQGLPRDLPSLLAQGPEALRRALQAALDANLIPAGVQVDQTMDQLQTLATRPPGTLLTTPVFLFQPQVLFGTLGDLSKLGKEQGEFLAAKLNEHLRAELTRTIGSTSEAMDRALQTAVARVDYAACKDKSVQVVAAGVLGEIKQDPRLADEASQLEQRVAGRSPRLVSELLRLDAPLKDNPLLQADIQVARNLTYAGLVGLDSAAAKKLADKHLDLENADDSALAGLVKEGILTDAQKTDLRLTIDLGRLTGDNEPAISCLKKEPGIKSPADFAGWDKDDWQGFIGKNQVPLPPGETAETYAENIQFNVERTFPTQALFARLLRPQARARLDALDSVNDLLNNNDGLIDRGRPVQFQWKDIATEGQPELQLKLRDLAAFANTYRHLRIPDLVNDKGLTLAQKKEAIQARLNLIDTFYRMNPDLDLRQVDLVHSNDGAIDWTGISFADQPAVRKQLMAYQRVLTLAGTTESAQALLSTGHDSAIAIAGKTLGEFKTASGLTPGEATLMFDRAQQVSASAAQAFGAIRDIAEGGFPGLAVSNVDPALVNDLREIEGYDVLFGSQSRCACDECKSMLGPAAYFVDLMYFIKQHVLDPVFAGDPAHPANPLHLRQRRDDLWTLALTCENTHKLIPYLTIVNEVLEHAIGDDVYQQLADPGNKVSFSVPFNLPLEELRLYLGHFGISLHEIYKTLGQSSEKIWRARLSLSKEECAVITTPDTAGAKLRFGDPSPLDPLDVQDLIRPAGITRDQLDELLALTFWPLQAVKIDKADPDELENSGEVLTGLDDSCLDFIHRFVRLWRKTPWSIPELDQVLVALGNTSLVQRTLYGDVVACLGRSVEFQEDLQLTVEELCAILDQMPDKLFELDFRPLPELYALNNADLDSFTG